MGYPWPVLSLGLELSAKHSWKPENYKIIFLIGVCENMRRIQTDILGGE